MRKRKTEVDPADRRSSARSAREAGIATPAIDRLVALIHDVEDGRRPLSFATFQELIDTCTSAYDGRVALVTGAAQGIGQAIAIGLKDGGAQVHVADLDAAGVNTFAKRTHSPRTSLDVSDRKAARDAVGKIVIAAEGRLDILVNAAGGVRGQVGRPIEDVSEDDWRVIFQANVDGAFWLAQAAAAPMRQAGFGRIVNIASGAGLRPSLTGIQAYTAAKHALVGLTKQLSQDLGPLRHHLQRGRAGLRALQSVDRAPMAELRRRRPEAAGRGVAYAPAPARPRISRTRCCSWRATRRAGSPGRSCRSMGEGRNRACYCAARE